jgi:hypothetical protein
MESYKIDTLDFYDGRTNAIDKKRIIKFEIEAVINRYYGGENIAAVTLIEDLGSIQLDFTNVLPWAEDIPDIDKQSARLFTLWAEDQSSKDIVLILRGIYVLLPFEWRKETLEDYYDFSQENLYYPMAVLSNFRTVFKDKNTLIRLIDRVKDEIELNWQKIRKKTINRLEKGSDLWKRYLLCFEQIIHYSVACPSMDRELIGAFQNQGFRTMSVIQLMASPTSSYDLAMVKSHLSEVKEIIYQGMRR